jgi:hypothetical protein
MAYDLATKKQTARDWSIGAGLTTTTEDVDLRLRQLTTETNGLNVDITQIWYPKAKKDPQTQIFVNAWVRWRDDTYAFVKSWKEGPFYKIHMAWNFLNNATDRLRELADWRAKWQKLSGLEATAPSGTVPPDAGSKPPTDTNTNWWKWAAIGSAGGLGAILIGRKLKQIVNPLG